MLLDTLPGVALSSIKNPAIQQPFSHVNLKNYLATRQRMIDRTLDHFLPKANATPPTIHKAMRYSFSPGENASGRFSVSRPLKPLAARSIMRCPSPARLNASTPTHSFTMIFRAWITTISGGVARHATRFSAKASPCSQATHSSPSPSKSSHVQSRGDATICRFCFVKLRWLLAVKN